MLIQATLIADADGAPIIRNTMRTDLQHFPMLANPSILTDIEVIANSSSIEQVTIKPLQPTVAFAPRYVPFAK